MCIVSKLFKQQGFEVINVSRTGKHPMVMVRGLPRGYRIKKTVALCTDVAGIQYRLGMWLGCHVAVIQ
ncbi:MAG: hypothetical protein V5786_10355 [Psychromonas sp.]